MCYQLLEEVMVMAAPPGISVDFSHIGMTCTLFALLRVSPPLHSLSRLSRLSRSIGTLYVLDNKQRGIFSLADIHQFVDFCTSLKKIFRPHEFRVRAWTDSPASNSRVVSWPHVLACGYVAVLLAVLCRVDWKGCAL